MVCPWCANPEGMSLQGTQMKDSHGTTKTRMSFKPIDCDALVAEVLSSRSILIDGGGVTFSGGEPTLQFEALLYILKQLKQENIHIAIETNATHPRLLELLPYLDLLIADLKHSDSEIHKKYTGLPNETIIENLKFASQKNLELWIRTPLINGFNADADFIEGFINIYKQFNLRNTSFELLRYHEFGKTKWAQCGKEYTITDGHVTDEIVYAYEKAYLQAGLKVIHT
jgi:pyruvate formate lyase activating enzyme